MPEHSASPAVVHCSLVRTYNPRGGDALADGQVGGQVGEQAGEQADGPADGQVDGQADGPVGVAWACIPMKRSYHFHIRHDHLVVVRYLSHALDGEGYNSHVLRLHLSDSCCMMPVMAAEEAEEEGTRIPS